MNYNNKIVDIVAHIYESVAYDDVWEDVIGEICEAIGAYGGYLTVTDRKSQQISMVGNRVSGTTIDSYVEEHAPHDERRLNIEDLSIGSIKKGSELLEAITYKQSKIYKELLKEIYCFHTISTCFYRDTQFVASITFFRQESEPDFDNQSKKILGIFIPHLTRAFTISTQTKLAQLQTQIQEQIKSSTEAAVFLITEHYISKPMNTRAEEFAKSSSVLALKHDRLTLKNQAANKRLQHLIMQCILASQGLDMFPGGFIRLDAYLGGGQEWHIGVTPYRKSAHQDKLWKAKGALVVMRPVEEDSFEKLNIVLSDFYGLTASETQVLSKVISGLSGSEIAEELNLTKECVRSRLKKIYQKTGVSNQVQLTHNILEGPYKLVNMLG
jgi:DNA-binding CsgD family transcriptional regulator